MDIDTALWVLQLVVAGLFLLFGTVHAFRFDDFVSRPRTAWGRDVGQRSMRIIGLLEIAGGVGLVLPAATGVLPWLTWLAGLGIAGLMLAAILFHARRAGEAGAIVFDAGLGALALIVAYGRLVLEPL